tara:strand:+ start:13068 stop:13397 length:330 start_codon:yes stop_codon:yes gene_type:complete
MKNQKLGEFEELVLLAIGALQEDAYTVSIQQILEEYATRSTSMGAIYTSLERLTKKGYLSSKMSEPTAERGGKSKRVYQVTYAGEVALRDTQAIRDSLWKQFNWSPSWG